MRFLLPALVGVALVGFLQSCSGGEAKPAPGGSEPVTPAEEFKKIGEDLYAGQCPQYGKAPRETFEAQLADQNLPTGKRLPLLIDLANEYLEAGDVKRSIETLDKAMDLARSGDNGRQQRKVVRELAQAWLREAENQNCIQRHNADCCILPARAGALHTVRQPAERARSLYQMVLADNPENLAARWLINLTTLLLGESPDALP